ncbi:MAG TPA: hypothetical protein VM848_18720 [Acidimicrobiia bacterium]|nr:hypothetical protein [Acidimicrobiia bacterium]
MKQARRGLGGWRQAILITGLLSILMVALPAQAGLGDLRDDLLDPIEDVPVVGPVAGDLIDPVVDEVLAPVLTPIVDTVVTPIVDEVVTPVPDNVVDPVTETIPTVGETTTTTLLVGVPDQEAAVSDSSGFGVSSSGYPGGVLLTDSNNDGEVLLVQSTTDLQSLEAARALQTTLVDSGVTELSIVEVAQPTAAEMVDAGWLNGLTNWLRTSADGLLNLLALPIRLLELLARALLTAGSGLIAPLSMLLAFTAVLIKDRRWGHAEV